MTNIISNRIIYPTAYVEALTGQYPLRCDTIDETINHLHAQHVYTSTGYDLKSLPELFAKNEKSDAEKYYIFVEFSLEEKYTDHEVRLMPVQKRYLARVRKYMEDFEAAYNAPKNKI